MEPMNQMEVVGRIRSDLQSLMGTRMKLRANMGRSKIVEREGVLEETHPSLFVVKVEEKRARTARVSYSYVDVLTGTVELTHPDSGDSGKRRYRDDTSGAASAPLALHHDVITMGPCDQIAHDGDSDQGPLGSSRFPASPGRRIRATEPAHR